MAANWFGVKSILSLNIRRDEMGITHCKSVNKILPFLQVIRLNTMFCQIAKSHVIRLNAIYFERQRRSFLDFNNNNSNNNNNNNNKFRAFYIVSTPLQYLKESLKNLKKSEEKFTIHRINPRETN